jgi:hypothetical protein
MKMDSLDDLKKEYTRATGKEPAIRWNRTTLQKKITDAEILTAGYAKIDGAMKKQTVEPSDPNPEFEKLAADDENSSGAKAGEAGPPYDQGESSQPADGRGGPREGAGRPTGQTDERARVERVMAIEVPDLAVGIGVDALNTGLARITGVGIDDKAVASEALANMPHGSQSLALGLTRLLYYWFPSLQGRTDVVTLHLEALFLIMNPFRERAEKVNQLIKQQKETEHAKEKIQPETPEAVPAAAPADGASPGVKPWSNPKDKTAKARSKK